MSSPNASCVFMGSESLLIQCAEIWLARGQIIRAVVSDDAAIRAFAERREIPWLPPQGDLASALAAPAAPAGQAGQAGQAFDYFFSVANLRMVPEDVLSLPRQLAINFHDGPLPHCAGRNVTTWALLRGASRHGVTWHVMTAGADEGDLLLERHFDVAAEDTALTLNTRCYEAGIESFAELADRLLSAGVEARAQDLSKRVYFGRHDRPAAACTLDFQLAGDTEALVRALDFGSYANPVGCPKLIAGTGADCAVLVGSARTLESPSTLPPGTLVALSDSEIQVATASHDVGLGDFRTLEGAPITLRDFARDAGLQLRKSLGTLGALAPEPRAALSRVAEEFAPHEPFWIRRLERLEAIQLPGVQHRASGAPGSLRSDTAEHGARSLPLSAGAEPGRAHARVIAAFAGLLARLRGGDAPAGATVFHMDYRDARLAERLAEAGSCEFLFASRVPLRIELDPQEGFEALQERVAGELARVAQRGTYLRDVQARTPSLLGRALGLPVAIEIAEDLSQVALAPGSDFTLALAADGSEMRCLWDRAVLDEAAIEALEERLARFLAALEVQPGTRIAQLPLLSDDERRELLVDWNETSVDLDTDQCVHTLFESQVNRTPDAVALVAGEESLRFVELNRRANRLAHRLRSLGVGPDVLVGVCLERTAELVVAILAIQKAGGAYLPLDPDFPADRLAFMLEDAAVSVLVTQASLRGRVAEGAAAVLEVDADAELIAAEPDRNIATSESGVRPDHLAYVIYTSGSTGRPKGVQVEHRNVVNFFAGMDAVMSPADPGVWLAVTSLSFDISVLELFWTLARGFKLVLYRGGAAAAHAGKAERPVSFSLNYFASDASYEGGSGERYRLLLEGARFADRHGFEAVWMPERHFHDFGGLYPNPSVTAAALATITQHVELRAGSCVLPLHDPLRVAEEWSVVDNLSNGRVGLAFASGWQPNDFVLQPDNFAEAKSLMFRELETVRKLWRGEEIERQGPRGPVRVATLPRPVQPEIPSWITTAGSDETFRMAAQAGANILTHLLGQSIEELAGKIELYRRAWREAGQPGEGKVTLLLHTFVGEDEKWVRDNVREPMKRYLASAMSLVKDAAFEFPTFKKVTAATGKGLDEIFAEGLEDAELDAVLEFAFERYYETSGLFGTPEDCIARVASLSAIGVDEITCLIDFGVDPDRVLEHLKQLDRVREHFAADGSGEAAPASIPELLARHEVSHMQCTPSMAGMLLADDDARQALGSLGTLLLGGEALPLALARDLASVTPARIVNMYGPTETTIWSSTADVRPTDDSISIGRPIANTQLYVVDGNLEPVPVGTPGELLIGGDGVVRGYLGRPDLNAERFVPDHFRDGGAREARLYRTGDRVQYRSDGQLDFLGRADHQVKLRGYRIELGEIEAALECVESIREAVVIAREDVPGDRRLVAYCLTRGAVELDETSLRQSLGQALPDYMLPAHFVHLPHFPLTPNAKVDRKALPPPAGQRIRNARRGACAPPENDLQRSVLAIWRELLQVDEVGLDDNFFDLGGHSLLAVQVHRRIREDIEAPLSMTDLFRLPTVRALSQHLAGEGGDDEQVAARSEDRAAARRAGMARRRRKRRD